MSGKTALSRSPLPPRRLAGILCAAALTEGAFAWLAALLLRHSGGLLGLLGARFFPDEAAVGTLAGIFGALRTAVIRPRPVLPFLLCAAVCAAFTWFVSSAAGTVGRRMRIVFGALPLLLLLAAAFLLTLWLTDVNGIRFGTVVLSLVKTVRSGALDALEAGRRAVLCV